MTTVGSVLRAERLRQGLSIDAISIDTKISIVRLEALEADEVESFSSPFFYKSFVKQVAERLKIDPTAIAEVLESQASSLRQPLLPGEDGRHLPNVPALENVGERARARWLIPVVSLVAVVVAASGIFAWWEQASGAKRPSNAPFSLPTAVVAGSSTSKSNQPPQATAKPETTSKAKESLPSQKEAADAGTTPAAVAGNDSPIQVEVAALDNVWISVVSDGKFIFSGILSTAESKSFSSREMTRVKVGNAAALSVKYNGRQIGPLGARGSVCTAIFTAKNFEIVEPQPHVELTGYLSENE